MKTLASIFGLLLMAVGILGFVPAVTPNEHFLGIFHVNGAHNVVHLLSGAIALFCAMKSEHASRLFFRVFGVIYAGVALLGFMSGDQPIFGVMSNNRADVWLHVGIAVVSLFLGFAHRRVPRRVEQTA
jgi:hypothetical protein